MILHLKRHTANTLSHSLEVLCADQNFRFENEEDRENYEILLTKVRRILIAGQGQIDLSTELMTIVLDEFEVKLEIERSNLAFFEKGGQFENGEHRLGQPGEPVNRFHVSLSRLIVGEIEEVIKEIEKFFEISD